MSYPRSQRWLSAIVVLLSLWLAAGMALAADFLDAEQAFQLKAELRDANTATLNWNIAPGYKLYRERLHFSVDGKGAELGNPAMPHGIRAMDPNFGEEVETYHDQLAVVLPLKQATGPFILKVEYQGCAEAGLCYPPVEQRFSVNPLHPGALSLAKAVPEAAVASGQPMQPAPAEATLPEDASSLAARTLQGGSLWRICLAFLVFGLLLSFTPCVLPMVPILSSMIVGQGEVTRGRGFLLAGAYCLGMALVYTALGIAAGLAGEGLAGALQKPAVLAAFALLMVVLALSMFDVYQLQLPSALQTRLSQAGGRMQGGRFVGVFLMGAISALIVGPCVAAPLAGALMYISQTHDVLIGGWALFSMAMGMSVPLLLTGLSAGSLLPHVGGWMNEVKHLFGLMLIGVAIWMVMPILPVWATLAAWGIFAIICAVFLRVFDALPGHVGVGARFGKAAGLVLLTIGVFELMGAASGAQDVLKPLAQMQAVKNASAAASPREQRFTRVHSMADLEQAVKSSATPVLLDFYADWCVACKEMERNTFNDPKVAEQFERLTLLQVDVTANSQEDRALMKKFGLFGPPGIILFNTAGQEVPKSRIIGYLEANAFLAHIKKFLAMAGATAQSLS